MVKSIQNIRFVILFNQRSVNMRIAIGADHGGFDYKKEIIDLFNEKYKLERS